MTDNMMAVLLFTFAAFIVLFISWYRQSREIDQLAGKVIELELEINMINIADQVELINRMLEGFDDRHSKPKKIKVGADGELMEVE